MAPRKKVTRARRRPGRLTGRSSSAAAWPPPAYALYHGLPLSYGVTLPVLGIPVKFSSNSTDVLDAVEESFGIWRGFKPTSARDGRREPITVRLIVFRGDERGHAWVPLTWHIPDGRRAVFHSPGSVGMLDLDRRDVFAYVTPALMADRAHFRYSVLEALTLTTVNDSDRYPVHAGGLVRNGTVLLLAGHSGSGKSTLVYAAMRSGLNVLSDDAVYVQTHPAFRIWGAPGRLYLRPEARRHFAELSSLESVVLANGKTKVMVPVDRARAAPVAVVAKRVGVVLLARGRGSVSVRAVSPRTLESALTRDLALPIARYGSNMRTVVRRLTARGGWRLTISPRPAESLPFLHRIFDWLDRRPPLKAG